MDVVAVRLAPGLVVLGDRPVASGTGLVGHVHGMAAIAGFVARVDVRRGVFDERIVLRPGAEHRDLRVGAARAQAPRSYPSPHDGNIWGGDRRRAQLTVTASSSRVTAVRLCRDRALGHHMRSPRSRLSAVTRIDRTMNASSSTPKATANPISANPMSGSVASTANVPARTRPADVMTPPVAARPVSAPARVPSVIASSRTRVIRKML